MFYATEMSYTGACVSYSEKSHPQSQTRTMTQACSRPRLWAVTYVCTVALQCFFLLGFSAGFTSPVLTELSDKQDRYRSLKRKTDQDLFNVSLAIDPRPVS